MYLTKTSDVLSLPLHCGIAKLFKVFKETHTNCMNGIWGLILGFQFLSFLIDIVWLFGFVLVFNNIAQIYILWMILSSFALRYFSCSRLCYCQPTSCWIVFCNFSLCPWIWRCWNRSIPVWRMLENSKLTSALLWGSPTSLDVLSIDEIHVNRLAFRESNIIAIRWSIDDALYPNTGINKHFWVRMEVSSLTLLFRSQWGEE